MKRVALWHLNHLAIGMALGELIAAVASHRWIHVLVLLAMIAVAYVWLRDGWQDLQERLEVRP